MKRKHAALKRLEDARTLAAANGGICLTTESIDERANFEFTCSKGHRNFFKRHDAVMLGKYCPRCGMKAKGERQVKYSKQSLDEHAATKGGVCLTESYLGYNENHRWQCAEGHEWDANPRMVIGMGSWCPHCAGNAKYTVDVLSKIVEQRGGTCLELSYDPVKERSTGLWQCHFGHSWYARTDTVIGRGDWCPHCKTSYGERLARQILQKLYDAPFLKVRPGWLMGEKRMPLEIDMYNESLFGAEYQGDHHYKRTTYSHDNLEQVQKRDAIKVATFEKRGEKLILLPEFNDLTDAGACIESVKDILKAYGVLIPERAIQIDYREVYINIEGVEFFKQLHVYVAEHRGALVNDLYIGRSRNYKVTCEHGHVFNLNEVDMQRGKWCRSCADHQIFLKYKGLVEKKNGVMLSTTFSGYRVPFEIECKNGHRFKLTSHNLSHGYWCKECRLLYSQINLTT